MSYEHQQITYRRLYFLPATGEYCISGIKLKEKNMRQIKFRVWDIAKQAFIPDSIYGIITTDFGAFGVMLKDWEEYKEGEYFYPNAQVLQQFTGLTDKYGKEICEGDIVKAHDHPTGVDDTVGYVFYFQGCWEVSGSMMKLCEFSKEWLEIIGNTHETRELLKR